ALCALDPQPVEPHDALELQTARPRGAQAGGKLLGRVARNLTPMQRQLRLQLREARQQLQRALRVLWLLGARPDWQGGERPRRPGATEPAIRAVPRLSRR